MRKLLALSALLFLVTFALSQSDTTAVIAAWNVAGFQPISATKAEFIAKAIADLDAEVIALCEVKPDTIPDQLEDELDDLGADYDSVILDQTAGQNLAVLFKTGVTLTHPQLIAGSDDGNPSLRKALVANVKVGQFDFILISVHLKAGRQSSARAIRNRQADVIADFIENATSGAEKDVLLVGDYNMIPGQDLSNFTRISANGFLRFISSEDLAGEISHISNPEGPTGSLLDGFAISNNHTREYVEGSLFIFPVFRALGLELTEYKEEVSDHLPLVARFRVTTDDD